MQRLRMTFSRDKSVRFVGHLDLAKAWERILRRADLPVAHSQGFHPLPKITFASALPVGCTSEAELMDVVLTEPMDAASVTARLAPSLPAGIAVTDVVEVPLNVPALQAELRWAEYRVTVETQETREQIEARLQAVLSATAVMRERRGKTYDLRPLVLSLSVEQVNDVSARITMRLMADASAGTGRPDEVLAALGWSDALAQIHRRKLGFAS